LNKKSALPYHKKLGIFALALIFLKLALFPLVQEVDADAISRIYLSLSFAESPRIIQTGNWPPLFFYLMGGALKLYENQFFTPVFVNIVLSALLLFPLYSLFRRHFNEKIAFLLCIIFSFSPIVFRLSLLAMSEIPYLFFVVLSLNALSKSLVEKKVIWSLLAGLFMTVAGGIRYESWILGALIACFLAYYKSPKEFLLFFISFALFPVYWLISNFIHADDALSSFMWAIDLSESKSSLSFESILRRIWWFPLSLMFAFGPVAFYFFIRELKHFQKDKIGRPVLIVFAVFLGIWIINALRGSLLLQHRFAVTLFLLSLPVIGYYFQRKSKRLETKTLIFAVSAFFLAYVYSSKGARPIPRLKNTDAEKISEQINANLNAKSGFICDFWNWQTTYYLPFSTGLPRQQIRIIEDGQSLEIIEAKISSLIEKQPQGVILIGKDQRMQTLLKTDNNEFTLNLSVSRIPLKPFYQNEDISCFSYVFDPE